jgi:S-adenosylmethionine hydrolase
MRPSGIITLTTDFGHADSYVGIMKGVILGIAPHAHLIDTTHQIHPQDVQQAAYVIETFHHYFPVGTVHLVVVDPGVGGTRYPIALVTPHCFFVAPDNGVLTSVWRDAIARWGATSCKVIHLTERCFWLTAVSNTFHGRDIFAPVAAHLAAGTPNEKLCVPLAAPGEAQFVKPAQGRGGELIGRIVHVDHFGNCVTNMTLQHLESLGAVELLTIKIIDQLIGGLRRTYADGQSGMLIALIGSSGRLELSVCNGSAAQTLGVGIGDTVKVFSAERAIGK